MLHGISLLVTVSDVKTFVESYTGKGSIAVMKLRHGKGWVRRAFTIIQFTIEECVASMISMAKIVLSGLRYGIVCLKVRVLENDIDQKLRMDFPGLEGVKLYFGYQISKGEFCILKTIFKMLV